MQVSDNQTDTLFPVKLDEDQLRALGKLLLNSWSAEYALRITPLVDDDSYLQQSLYALRITTLVDEESLAQQSLYALHITPLADEESSVQQSLDWSFPQVYYSALFSARAVLLVTGYTTANENAVSEAMGVMARDGLYGAGYDELINPYSLLELYRISGRPFNKAIVAWFIQLAGIKRVHAELIEKAQFIALTHERYILEAIGPGAYQALLDRVPAYLKEAFISQRVAQLLTPDLA